MGSWNTCGKAEKIVKLTIAGGGDYSVLKSQKEYRFEEVAIPIDKSTSNNNEDY